MSHLFIYGTLRDHEVCEKVLGRHVSPDDLTEAYALDFATFKVADVSYPCLLPEAGGRAKGCLLTGLSERDLALLDKFEGANYTRVPIEIICGDEAQMAEYYQPNQKLQTDGAWDLATWQRDGKGDFLALDFNIEGVRAPAHA
jgi:gamma-glutamylcyclotransferase (GGCT)/AIG2-like uncharacterized protein YtfP